LNAGSGLVAGWFAETGVETAAALTTRIQVNASIFSSSSIRDIAVSLQDPEWVWANFSASQMPVEKNQLAFALNSESLWKHRNWILAPPYLLWRLVFGICCK